MSEKVYVYTCSTPGYEFVEIAPDALVRRVINNFGLSPSPSPVVEVTEENCHLAVSTFLAIYNGGNGLEAMRAALIAALRVR